MTQALRPGQGFVGGIGTAVADAARQAARPVPRSHHERPHPHASTLAADGCVVLMQRIPGVTAPGVLAKPFLFQVPPLDDLSYQGGHVFNDYDTLDAGQHSRVQSRLLKTISFRSMFVADQATYTVVRKPGWIPDPLKLRAEMQAIADAGEPFRLTVYVPIMYDDPFLDMAATIRTYEITLPTGEADTVYFTVSFSEHRPLSGDLRFSFDPDKLPVSLDVFRLTPGSDTLHALAKKHYGDPAKWKLIAKQNGLRVSPSESLRAHMTKHGKAKVIVPKPPQGQRQDAQALTNAAVKTFRAGG